MPRKYPDDFINKIICGDCLEVMREMPDCSMDVILTDPPYKDEDVYGDYEYWPFFTKFFEQANRVAKDYVIFFNNASRLYEILQILGEPKRILMWIKRGIQYNQRWEPIFIYPINPDFNINSLIWSDILPYQPIFKSKSLHTYEKPLDLMINILRYIREDKFIFDPFAGSGTTLVACKEMKRYFTGIEINRNYCKIAEERLAQGVL